MNCTKSERGHSIIPTFSGEKPTFRWNPPLKFGKFQPQYFYKKFVLIEKKSVGKHNISKIRVNYLTRRFCLRCQNVSLNSFNKVLIFIDGDLGVAINWPSSLLRSPSHDSNYYVQISRRILEYNDSLNFQFFQISFFDSPFPSSGLPLSQNESWCKTFLIKKQVLFAWKWTCWWNTFSEEWFRT